MLRRWTLMTLVLAVLLSSSAGCRDSDKPAKIPEPIPAQRFPQKHKK